MRACISTRFVWLVSISMLALALGAQGDSTTHDVVETPADPASEATVKESSNELPVFVPRNTGSPMTRIGGATRGVGQIQIPVVDAFAPEQVGYTIDAQPALFWYVSQTTQQRVDFTLLGPASETPIVQKTLSRPLVAGVQRIDLSDFDVSLEPGVTYFWYVSLIPDLGRRSEDRIAGGAIERVAGSPELGMRLAAQQSDRHVFVLADEGIWYDAVRAVTERIDATPDGDMARAQRAALLEQVGLDSLAKRDRDGI